VFTAPIFMPVAHRICKRFITDTFTVTHFTNKLKQCLKVFVLFFSELCSLRIGQIEINS